MSNTAGSHNSTVYSLHKSLDSLKYLASSSVFENQFWLTHLLNNYQVFITEESRLYNDEYIEESGLHSCEYIDSAGILITIRIIPEIFNKIQNLFKACLMGPGEVLDE